MELRLEEGVRESQASMQKRSDRPQPYTNGESHKEEKRLFVRTCRTLRTFVLK